MIIYVTVYLLELEFGSGQMIARWGHTGGKDIWILAQFRPCQSVQYRRAGSEVVSNALKCHVTLPNVRVHQGTCWPMIGSKMSLYHVRLEPFSWLFQKPTLSIIQKMNWQSTKVWRVSKIYETFYFSNTLYSLRKMTTITFNKKP